jgi:hypothetical protein
LQHYSYHYYYCLRPLPGSYEQSYGTVLRGDMVSK